MVTAFQESLIASLQNRLTDPGVECLEGPHLGGVEKPVGPVQI